MPVESEFLEILRLLARHDVEFMVCGGIAAVLHGAPIMTLDVDVLFEASEINAQKLMPALEALEAVYFDVAGREILPDLDKLRSLRLHLLKTNLGRLDLLREIAPGWDYRDLLDRSEEIELDGLRLKVLSLEAIIESKESAARPKDLAALPFLRSTLALKRSQD
ncbi:MAG: hypothetical protein K8J08_03415 [Thermoanaerobaculia bacterium]|nr:hypothetical protein [Thermoanaerobaculia bacterium]